AVPLVLGASGRPSSPILLKLSPCSPDDGRCSSPQERPYISMIHQPNRVAARGRPALDCLPRSRSACYRCDQPGQVHDEIQNSCVLLMEPHKYDLFERRVCGCRNVEPFSCRLCSWQSSSPQLLGWW